MAISPKLRKSLEDALVGAFGAPGTLGAAYQALGPTGENLVQEWVLIAILTPKDPRVSDARPPAAWLEGGTMVLCQRYGIPLILDAV